MPEKIFFISLIVSFLVIIFILIRKFPVLAVLNVDNIPGEKEASFKKEIIKRRVDRDLARVSGVFASFWLSLKKHFHGTLSLIEKALKSIKSSHKKKERIAPEDKEKIINNLMLDKEDAQKKKNNDLMEEKLLEIINLDAKNLKAFFDLGLLYWEEKKLKEASETLSYLLKLLEKNGEDEKNYLEVSIAEIYFSLASIDLESENLESAINNINESLDREPNNPRYLDLILDLSIMKKDKNLALRYFKRMSEINPENSKLKTWFEDIESME